jgi:hypothetical protein
MEGVRLSELVPEPGGASGGSGGETAQELGDAAADRG